MAKLNTRASVLPDSTPRRALEPQAEARSVARMLQAASRLVNPTIPVPKSQLANPTIPIGKIEPASVALKSKSSSFP
ncbi:MAG: hypothetical protein J6X44_09585 [Thermoguttaceae bacterium]|nr:hypothetical protein [Thermoguttaceae bacterium]